MPAAGSARSQFGSKSALWYLQSSAVSRPELRTPTTAHIPRPDLGAGCFLLEIPLAVFGFGLRYYCRPLHLFDAIVVVTTFVLDVLLRGQEAQIAGLLVLLRLWRLLKLTTSVAVGTEEYQEEEEDTTVAKLRAQRDRLRRELLGARRELAELRRRSARGSEEGL